MSFQDSDALEGKLRRSSRDGVCCPIAAQQGNWRNNDDDNYVDDPEFQRFTTDLSDKLFTLTSNIANLSTQVGKLGTKKETERVRERVQDLLESTSNGFKEVGEGLKKVQSWQDLGVSGYDRRFIQILTRDSHHNATHRAS